MRSINDILQHPSARLTQHLSLSIGTLDAPLDVLDARIEEGFNQTYSADLTVTSSDLMIDGAVCVGRPAIFTIDEQAAIPSAPGLVAPVVVPAKIVHGVLTRWERVKASRDEATYRLRIEPRVALLDQIHDSGVFNDTNLKRLITGLVVDRRLFDSFDLEFALETANEQFEQTVMYEESVWSFIARHCRRAGVFWYFRQGRKEDRPRRDTIVFGDNPRAYERALELPVVPYSGLNGNWHEAVLEISTVRTLVPEAIELWEHNYRTPEDPLKIEARVARDDRSVSGRVNRSTEHYHDGVTGRALVNARREELVSRQTIFRGTTNSLGMRPGMVVRLTNHELAGAKYGFVVTKLVTEVSRTQPAFSSFEGTPSHLTYRPEYDPAKHWRRVASIPGIVTSSDDGPYASLDEHGRYTVKPQFLCSSGTRGKGLLSLRLLRASASYQGGFHAPLLPDTEVRLDATNGDIDRLFIAGALHDFTHPDLVHGLSGWNSRAVWRSPLLSGKIRFEDLKGREGAKFATVYLKSSVSLGDLVDSQKKKRGEGFEISTQGWGAMHAAKGLFFSAEGLSGSNARQLDMPRALGQLEAALAQAESMRTVAERATAELAEVKAQQIQLENAFKDLQKAVILLSAPEGIGAVTPKSIQLSGGEHLTVTAGANADFSVGRSFTVASGNAVSLLANQSGIKALAVNGKVDLQAQHGEMSLVSHDGLSIASSEGRVVITAREEILLVCGGSYLRIGPTGIEDGTRGDRTIHSASYQKLGPQSVSAAIPALPGATGAYDQAFVVHWGGTQVPAIKSKYQLFSEGKLIAEGITNEKGETTLAQSHVPQDAVLKLVDY